MLTFMEQVRSLNTQVEKMSSLHVDGAEYSCLKAIVLFNPGRCNTFSFLILIDTLNISRYTKTVHHFGTSITSLTSDQVKVCELS